MTTPDPYGPGQPPPPPGYGQPPAYGQQYGQLPYGGMPQGSFGGTLASWPTRVGSWVIDALVVGVPYVALLVLGIAIGSGALVAIGILVGFGLGVWNLIRQGRTGQTIGKGVVGTYLVREADGQFIGGGLSFARQIVHVVDGFCMLGYLWPLWDPKKQTFADKIMGTLVVRR